MQRTILWFKRDLRIADHPALALAAAGGGPVLPLYIAEPEYWAGADTAARQWQFVAESLAELRAALAALGQPLVVRSGEAVAVLAALRSAWPFERIVSHEETGTLWTYARDRRVAAWARAEGVAWVELAQSGVVRGLASRDGWAARREAFVAARPAAPPRALAPVPGIEPGPIPSDAELGLAPDPCPGRQRGGRAAALSLLASFLGGRGAGYRRAMAAPASGSEACSRLSPHLAWGTISGREAAQAAARAEAEAAREARRAARAAARGGAADTARGTDPGRGGTAAAGDGRGPSAADLAAFAARLTWRDHFMQKLEDAPDLERRALHPGTEGLYPRPGDPARLAAWARGETGLPFADACMRALAATGWLNFRARAMLVSLACHLLGLDWRDAGPVLARRFTDYEPGIHWSQMQMQAGATGINRIRIYNPVKQGLDHDPDGAFTRRWCPELAPVPDRFLQTPWAWEGAGRLLGRAWPEPLADPAEAARAARERLHAARRVPGFAEAAAEVVRRHASRRSGPGGRHFVDDRAPQARRGRRAGGGGGGRQLAFDL
jgi:deoxyribodipyrimidine photo-lyase